MARAFLVVMDSVGAGGAPDAAAFGDEGANTLGHIARACAAGHADVGRSGPLHLPYLDSLGLGAAVKLASGANLGTGAVPHLIDILLNCAPQMVWGDEFFSTQPWRSNYNLQPDLGLHK